MSADCLDNLKNALKYIMEKNKIIQPLDALYQKYRYNKNNTSVDDHTKSAQVICTEWQKEIAGADIGIEVAICPDAKEKIDVIDYNAKTAYELKVSGKNVEHEFYKAIFKILTFNNNYPNKQIQKFVFITEEKGITSLEKATLFKETLKLSTLKIEVVGIEK